MNTFELQASLQRIGLYAGKLDGDYGPLTRRAVTDFQVGAGLVPDGVAGPKTLAAMREIHETMRPAPPIPSQEPITLPVAQIGDDPGTRFRQAKHYRMSRRGHSVVWIVIHSAECGETAGAAEALQNYAATMGDGRTASWHYAVDSDSVTQSVREAHVAFHAPPLNDCSIGIELAGKASQTVEQWSDPYSTALVLRAAALLGRVCSRQRIALRQVTDDALRSGLALAASLVARRATWSTLSSSAFGEFVFVDDWATLRATHGGVVTHAQVARVFKKSTHYDPGKHFPLSELLEIARRKP